MKGVFLPKLNLDSTFMPFSSGPEMENKVVGKDLANTSDSLMLKWAMSQRDRKALAALHAKYYAIIRHHIASRVDSAADAEDLAQDVFVELCKGNGQYDGPDDPEAYVFGVARNIIRQYYRKRAKSIKTIPIEEIGSVAAGHERRQHHLDPTSRIKKQELTEAIEEALAKLPPKARQAVKLRFMDGLTTEQAVKKCGCTLDTFRKRIYRTLERIRLHLNSRNESPEK
jgi:RNA polymerase sigma-70 factor (ECF subfamily)